MRGCTCRGGLALCPMCTQLAQRAGVLETPQAPAVSEKAFQSAVVRLAREHGWLVHTTYDSRKSPAGYPDLTLARMPGQERPGQLVIAELKVDAPLTIEQEVWLATLGMVTQTHAELWTPDAMAHIREILC